MADFIQVTLNGIAAGGLYAVLLIGILLVHHVSRVINFAHGQVAMVGGLGSYYLIDSHAFPLYAAIVVATVGTSLLSFVAKLLTDLTSKEGDGYDFVLPLGLFLVLTAFGQAVLHNAQASNFPRFTSASFGFAGAFVDVNVLITIGVTLLLVCAVFFILERTAIGLQIRAIATDPEVSEALCINARWLRAGVWTGAGASAAIAGVLIANQAPVDAFYVTPFLINALIAGVFGGLHRVVAPVVVAFALGILENWIVFEWGAQYRDVVVFGLAIIALGVAPVRWFAEPAEARA